MDALKREAFEEYGLKGDFAFKLIGKKIFYREVNGKKENHLFIVFEIYTDQPPVLNEESVGTKTFSVDELRHQLALQPNLFGDAMHFVAQEFYPYLLEASSK